MKFRTGQHKWFWIMGTMSLNNGDDWPGSRKFELMAWVAVSSPETKIGPWETGGRFFCGSRTAKYNPQTGLPIIR
ncbi:hypothetical protein DSCO28_71990 [Desulfosarcina ovata subsp. sediminis]|uniref:Uncharacterized protein n=2 Tax=Desulfosarcina ovata TaxID=83564 RepID=A0A5K8A253_9BACT|nr:hypothetical protein DSCO28_71990 [Desulfosarcina ovata subsp. sediminis]